MFEKGILYTFIKGIVMYVYFEFTVPLMAYSEVLIFKLFFCIEVIIRRCYLKCRKFSLLLPTVQKNDQRCCLQRLSFSVLFPTTWKSALISVHLCFSALIPTQRKKLSALLTTVWKIFEFKYLHEFETICKFTIGSQSGA
jgi:hypothetical protein